MKERILNFVIGIREERIKAGCWIFSVLGVFLLLFIIYSVTFGYISGLLAFKLAFYETIFFVGILILHRYYVSLIEAVASKAGFLYHSGTKERNLRPEVHRAKKLREQRDYQGAIKAYRKLFMEFPDRLDFLYEIGEIYRKDLNDSERAIRAYRELARKPEEGEYAYLVKEAKYHIDAFEGRTTEHAEEDGTK
jgi:tetratricopeptide (TPR) repeat protein